MSDVMELKPAGHYGVREAASATNQSRAALKESLIKFPHRVSLDYYVVEVLLRRGVVGYEISKQYFSIQSLITFDSPSVFRSALAVIFTGTTHSQLVDPHKPPSKAVGPLRICGNNRHSPPFTIMCFSRTICKEIIQTRPDLDASLFRDLSMSVSTFVYTHVS